MASIKHIVSKATQLNERGEILCWGYTLNLRTYLIAL